MLGLTALAYAIAHISLFAYDQNLRLLHVASEIAHRVYLMIGFTALLGLIALGVTSTDASIRQLGKNWKRLHRIVYKSRHSAYCTTSCSPRRMSGARS